MDEKQQPKGAAKLVYNIELRDLFAAAALTGILADSSLRAEPRVFAAAAYQYADEMLKAREWR